MTPIKLPIHPLQRLPVGEPEVTSSQETSSFLPPSTTLLPESSRSARAVPPPGNTTTFAGARRILSLSLSLPNPNKPDDKPNNSRAKQPQGPGQLKIKPAREGEGSLQRCTGPHYPVTTRKLRHQALGHETKIAATTDSAQQRAGGGALLPTAMSTTPDCRLPNRGSTAHSKGRANRTANDAHRSEAVARAARER